MPKRKNRKNSEIDNFIFFVIDVFLSLWFYMFFSIYLLVKAIVTRRPLEKHSLKQQKAYKRAFGGIVFIIILMIVGCWAVPGLWTLFVFLALIILIPLVIVLIIKRKRRQAITSDIHKHLYRALETMDSTARWYNSEEEANRELVTCLKAQGINDVTYQYRLGNGRTADAKVGNCLIEGKLSPDTSEVDRLIGQLSNYTQYSNKLNVVIYGNFDREAKRRIENEIHHRYLNRVFLTYLNNPRRQRGLNSY